MKNKRLCVRATAAVSRLLLYCEACPRPSVVRFFWQDIITSNGLLYSINCIINIGKDSFFQFHERGAHESMNIPNRSRLYE